MALFKMYGVPIKGCRTVDEYRQWFLREHTCECYALVNNSRLCKTCGLTVHTWKGARYNAKIEALVNTDCHIIGVGGSSESNRFLTDMKGRSYFGNFCEICGMHVSLHRGCRIQYGLTICEDCYNQGRYADA